MRIGMILDKTYPPDPRVENEALSLIESGYQVYLFCLTYTDTNHLEEYKGINICRYKSNRFIYKLSALAYELPFYAHFLKPKIKDFLIENRIEVIHIHDIRIAGSVFNINKSLKLPIVLDLHDNYPEVMKAYPHLKKFPGRFIISPKKWLKKEQEFIEKAVRVITVSAPFVNSIKNRLSKNKDKVILVPNSVRKQFYTNVKTDKAIIQRFSNNFTLLYIGDTGLRRGLQTAIQALPFILKKIKNIELVIVGKSTTDPILKKLVNDLNISNHVVFEGWQDQKLFPSYILASDIGISPLIRSKHHDLAYANKLFQYMSLGLPVLVSDAIAQKKLINESKSGMVHIEKDAQDFAKKVIQMYDNKDLYRTFEKNTREFITTKFNWQLTAEDLIKMYKELTKSK
jgi:glycosyltransferase involved in cell wall biosynthesis